MGRNAGWLTAVATLLEGEVKADRIYLPEDTFNLETFLQEVKTVYDQKQKGLFVVSEGILTQMPHQGKEVDGFGHVQMGGVAYQLAQLVKEKWGFSTRPIEFSLMQRAASQSISLVDSKEAIKVSSVAVRKAVKGKTDAMVVITRKSDQPYRVSYKLQKLSKIANVEKKMPPELVVDVHGEGTLMKQYVRPLIQGSPKFKYEHGLIKRAILKKVKVSR
jgi:6-phosphofructokinase 1